MYSLQIKLIAVVNGPILFINLLFSVHFNFGSFEVDLTLNTECYTWCYTQCHTLSGVYA
jgi:hypothetical protein